MEENTKSPEATPQTAKTAREKLENFWYYYKWHTVVGLFLIFVAVIVAFQMCSKPSYDIHVMYSGSYEMKRTSDNGDVPSYNAVVNALNRLCPDFSGDGRVSVDLLDLFVMTSDEMSDFAEQNPGKEINLSLVNQNTDTLYSNLIIGDYYVCFLSEAVFLQYDNAMDGAIFAPITPYTSSDKADYEYASERGIYLRSLDIYDVPELNKLPDDTVVCIRQYSEVSSLFGGSSGERQYKNSESFLRDLLS